MTRTSWVTIVGAFAVAAMGSYAVFVLAQGVGAPTPPASWLTHVFMAAVIALVFWRGRAVRRMVEGEDTSMTPLEAARVAMAAKTSAVVGSLLGGYFAAVILFVAGLPPAPARLDLLISALAGVALAVLMVVVGLVVERWCRVDPPEDENGVGAADPSAPSAA
nr:DUF3180 domain-containing protein [Actinomycetales bacterium]